MYKETSLIIKNTRHYMVLKIVATCLVSMDRYNLLKVKPSLMHIKCNRGANKTKAKGWD
jgi:hypothetical protein